MLLIVFESLTPPVSVYRAVTFCVSVYIIQDGIFVTFCDLFLFLYRPKWGGRKCYRQRTWPNYGTDAVKVPSKLVDRKLSRIWSREQERETSHIMLMKRTVQWWMSSQPPVKTLCAREQKWIRVALFQFPICLAHIRILLKIV